MKFKNDIMINNPGYDFTIVLCYDTDVFEIANKKPINWLEVEKYFRNLGVKKIIHIKAKKSVEDWLCLEITSICKWLRISTPSNLTGNGCQKLDMGNLLTQLSKTLSPLYKEFIDS